MTLFKEIMSKIELRKRFIEFDSFVKNHGATYDLTTDFANDDEINKLYKQLEEYLPLKFENTEGKYLTITEMSKQYNINESTLRTRLIRYKWTVEKTINTPIKRKLLENYPLENKASIGILQS